MLLNTFYLQMIEYLSFMSVMKQIKIVRRMTNKEEKK